MPAHPTQLSAPLSAERLRGFLEAAGSFSIVLKRAPSALGYQAVADFSVKLPAHEADTLAAIQQQLSAGRVYNSARAAVLKVTKLEDVQRIVQLLDGPFLSQTKQKEFSDWRACVQLMASGAHRTKDGLLRIALLRDQMHARTQWNKRNFCFVRKAVDPCHIVQQEGDVRPGCHICHDAAGIAIDVPLTKLGRKL